MRRPITMATLAVLTGLLFLSPPAKTAAAASLAERSDVAPGRDPATIPLLHQETAETTWRQAREELNRENYRRAAELFARVIERYPRYARVGDSYYWQAFALSRVGGTDNLQQALELIDTQRRRYPNADTRTDADALLVRIQTDLARTGDSDAAANVARTANRVLTRQQCPRAGEDDIRAVALNAVMQMDAQNAMPLLKEVMARKDVCSAPLRRRAVFLVSQHRTPETEDILLAAARSDPDAEVRGQAVFWLSQVNTEKALSAIETILMGSNDVRVQDRAILALSQHDSPRASQILRTWAESNQRPEHLRERAIFALSQRDDPRNTEFLRNLFGKLQSARLKERVLFALTQGSGQGNEKWLMEVALDEQEPVRLRKSAMFHASQQKGVPIQDFVRLYDRTSNPELKQQLIFVYSQRNERAAVDQLIKIARNEQNRKLREQALFWLRQSKDPRVRQVLRDSGRN